MAKNRKKKPQQKTPYIHVVTKSYFDHYTLVVRKLLQMLTFDPDLFDEFSKKQKLQMMEVRVLPPRVSVHCNHHVPRQYVEYIKKEVNVFMKQYFGDESFKLNYEDYLTIGIPFMLTVTDIATEQGDNASKFVKDFAYIIHKSEEEKPFEDPLLKFVQLQLFDVSKINIRIYGLKWRYQIESPKSLAGHIYITSMKPEVINFTYRNKSRPAYRLAFGNLMSDSPILFSVPYNTVMPGSNDTRQLKIYLQSHALLRIKERLDTLIPFNRNAAILSSLVENKMVRAKNGQMLFSFIDSNNQLVGYMPFTVEGDNLFVLTFVPLANQLTPEGDKLNKVLNLSKEDMLFLGMDKLSFYQYTDFSAIPKLKYALIEAGMWHLTEIKTEEIIQGRPLVKSAGIAAKFFQQTTPEPNTEEVLSEIEERY